MFLKELEMVSKSSLFPKEALLKFHQDPTSGTLSRLHLSSKSLPGVLEDLDVLDGVGEGVKMFIIS